MRQPTTSGVRLSELVASLSLATDLGLGQPMEHALRQTVIGSRLAAAAGLSEEDRASVFYVSLLAWLGCVADSHEMAKWFGDDLRLRSDSYYLDKAGLPMMRFLLGHVAAGEPPLRRVATSGRFLVGGIRVAMQSYLTSCQTTSEVAARLGLASQVSEALTQAFERWDGKGIPQGLAGAQIGQVMRVVHVADDAEVFSRVGGTSSALQMLQSRSGTEFDPALVELCQEHAETIFADLEAIDAWSVVIDGSSALDRPLEESELTAVLTTFADYADVKSPWFTGHSRAVAALAAAAAPGLGLSAADTTLVERAALVHRLGAIGISAGLWDKPGPLSAIEWERVRTVPYLTERVLSRQPRLAELGAVAGLYQERMDGSGYPRGLSGGAIPATGRLLAAADVYQAIGEARPHRPGLSAQERGNALLHEAAAGRLDAKAVRAVLTAAGHRVPKRPNLVAGLTEREVEVLQRLVRGWTNKQIAAGLSISPRTVNTHIEHIYTKIGASTRGAAAMYAMHHGLVDADARL